MGGVVGEGDNVAASVGTRVGIGVNVGARVVGAGVEDGVNVESPRYTFFTRGMSTVNFVVES